MNTKEKLQQWAQTLTVEELQHVVVELGEQCIESEVIRMGNYAPYWEGSGEPIVPGQKCFEEQLMSIDRQAEREQELGQPCCFCGYNGLVEEECLLDPEDTATHCVCWWDGEAS